MQKTQIKNLLESDTWQQWQTIVDLIAKLIKVPAALIMRIVDNEIEVFTASKSEGNPYEAGAKEELFGSGLYCETVINTKNKLLVANALKDPKWNKNPDIKLNMISYLGFPILFPDGKPFGTLCVLDQKENVYSNDIEALLESFRDLLQNHLSIIYMNQQLNDKNKDLLDYIEEINSLRSLLPICSSCKKIRDENNHWELLETHVAKNTKSEFTHTICPSCAKRLYPDIMTSKK